MKFVVRHIGTYEGKDLYFEAENIGAVYRHLFKNNTDIIDYMNNLFNKTKHVRPAVGWNKPGTTGSGSVGEYNFMYLKDINHDPVGDYDEEKCQQYMQYDWYKYINIEIFRLRKIWLQYHDGIWTAEKFIGKMLQVLDDDSLQNIFTYYNTNGSGYQFGNPLHEGETIIVEEYVEPTFVKL